MALLDAYGRPITHDEAPDDTRADGWANPQTGIGIWGQDKTKAASYLPVWRVLDQELTSLMNGSDIARKIVSARPEEMFREGFDIDADGISESQNTDIRQYATDILDVENQMLEGKRWGRLYGGALLVMDIDDGRDLTEPLDEENIRSFNGLSLVDRRYAYVQSQYAAMGATSKYGRAQIYLISNAVAGYGWDTAGASRITPKSRQQLTQEGAQTSLVHESRCIRFDGNPADIVTRQNLAGWSWSVLQVVYDAMRQFDGAFDSAAYLLSDASQGVFKLQGLMKAISSGNRAAIAMRLQLMEQSRSVMHGIALDAGTKDGQPTEDFTRVPTPFGGIPDLLDKMMLRMAAAADMPATELFGRAPAGLNATGDNDTRKWYAKIRSEQKNELGPQLKRVFKLLALSKTGPLGGKLVKGKPVQWDIDFHPLWAPTDLEIAQQRASQAQADGVYLDRGVVKPEEVAVGLKDVYPGLDVKAREQVLKQKVQFNPYENQPANTTANATGGNQGEPLSPRTPTPLMGTTGTQTTKGNLPAAAAAEQSEAASHGSQSPSTGGKPFEVKVHVKGATHAPPAQQQETPAAKNEPPAKKDEPPAKKSDEKKDAAPDTRTVAGDASIVIVWRPAGEILCISRPEPPYELALPGGMVDQGETPVHAGFRELREELGITVSELVDEGTITSPEGRTVHVYTATRWAGVPRAWEAGTRFAWLSPDALLQQASVFRSNVADLIARGILKKPVTSGGGNTGRPSSGDASPSAPPNRSPAPAPSPDTEDALDRQDAALLVALPALLMHRADADYARAVFEQLLQDYHAKDLGWVMTREWHLGAVPLARVNFASRDRWKASTDGTLPSYVEKLREGKVKPVIYVLPPGDDAKFDPVDGHHRTLANEALGRDPVAYWAKVPSEEGPWAHLHSLQKKGSSKFSPGETSRTTVASRDASRGETPETRADDGPPDEERGPDGKWTGGGGSSGAGGKKSGGSAHAVASKLVGQAMNHGGFTYRPGARAPKDGFIVSLPKSEGMNRVLDFKSLGTSKSAIRKKLVAEVASHIEHTRDWVAKDPGHYLGGYVEKNDKGKPVALHLDANEHHADRDHAIEAGNARNQISIWDVANGEEIKTGGTGR